MLMVISVLSSETLDSTLKSVLLILRQVLKEQPLDTFQLTI